LLAGLVAGFAAGFPDGVAEIGFGNGLPFFGAAARGAARGLADEASSLGWVVALVCGFAAETGLAAGVGLADVSGFGSDAAAA
jgi:hypothetical protein